MNITDMAFFIEDAHQRHTPGFEQIDFLLVRPRHGMIGVGQADKRNPFIFSIALKGFSVVWSHGENLRTARSEIRITVPQARQRRAAIRSHEPAQEIQHNDLVFVKIEKPNAVAVHIVELKIGGKFAGCDQFTHRDTLRSSFIRFNKA